MSIQQINLGSEPTGAGGDTLRQGFAKVNASLAGVDGNHVAGGAGFVTVSGAVALDLAASRVFHHTMTGNITALAFENLPDEAAYETAWIWVLQVNATGGYVLTGTPTVTWFNGSSFVDLDMTANAVNIVKFWRIGAITYAGLIYNGTTLLDELAFDFLADGTQKYVVRTPCTIDVANPTVHGAGTIVYEKNGAVITVATAFASGDRLEVTAEAGQSVTLGVFA